MNEARLAEAIEQGITWTCHVCGDTRPDRHIRVLKNRYTADPGATLTVSIRYCADRAECGEAAAYRLADKWSGVFITDVERVSGREVE